MEMPKEKIKQKHLADLALHHTVSEHPVLPAAALPQPNSQEDVHAFRGESTLKEKHMGLATKIFLILYHNKKSEQEIHSIYGTVNNRGETAIHCKDLPKISLLASY